ncbi:hypothetical protein AB0G86_25140 [Streptomyces scabiei]|uniref:hypothetical protein n=1 Tax=Streptomyces scabiei TaxID=1930 RepID=UPI0033EFF41C
MNIDHKEILRAYRENYEAVTYELVCQRLANKKLTDEIDALRKRLLAEETTDTDTTPQ